jgi:hypothetical protein
VVVGDHKKLGAIANFKEAIKQYMENSPLRSGTWHRPFESQQTW